MLKNENLKSVVKIRTLSVKELEDYIENLLTINLLELFPNKVICNLQIIEE